LIRVSFHFTVYHVAWSINGICKFFSRKTGLEWKTNEFGTHTERIWNGNGTAVVYNGLRDGKRSKIARRLWSIKDQSMFCSPLGKSPENKTVWRGEEREIPSSLWEEREVVAHRETAVRFYSRWRFFLGIWIGSCRECLGNKDPLWHIKFYHRLKRKSIFYYRTIGLVNSM
jgi:hypothetical protein